MKLIQAGLVAVVMVLGCVSAWAGPQEDDKVNIIQIGKKNPRACLYLLGGDIDSDRGAFPTGCHFNMLPNIDTTFTLE